MTTTPTTPAATDAGTHTGRPLAAVWVGVLAFSLGPALIAGASAPGPVLSFWRLWIGVPILGTLALWKARRRPIGSPSIGWSGWRWTLRSGLAFSLHQVLLMSALRTTSVVDVTLMNTLAPIVVAVLAVPLFGERPGLGFRAWSGVAIAGAAVVAIAGSTGPQGHPLGMALAAANVVFYALYFVNSKQARSHIETWAFLFGTVATSAVLVSIFVFATGASVTDVTRTDLLICLAIAVVPGAAGHFLVTWSLRWVPANVPPVVMLIIPAISGVLAWVFFGQVVTALEVAGGAVTLLGVFGAVRQPIDSVPTAIESLDLAEEL